MGQSVPLHPLIQNCPLPIRDRFIKQQSVE